jgi:hypothetical protein
MSAFLQALMDPSKFALPAWLPWATAACLAGLVACLGELWMIERTRNQLMLDEKLLREASLEITQNQLEAERIIDRREMEQLRAAPVPELAFLAPPHAAPGARSAWGVVTWDPTQRHGMLRFAGLPPAAADRRYEVWLEGPTPDSSQLCGTSMTDSADGLPIDLPSPVAPGYRILLIYGKKEGYPNLAETMAQGLIVLATPTPPGKISN